MKGTTGNLLNYNTAQKLRMIMFVKALADKPANNLESLKEFKSLFGGVGKVNNNPGSHVT